MSDAREPGADDGKAAEEEAAPKGPPEAYELTPPEGFEITPDVAEEVTPVLKELGLNNEQANKLMPLAGKFAERLQRSQMEAFQATAADWAKEAKEDPYLGGKNWTQTESYVAKAIDGLSAALPPIERQGENGETVTVTGVQQGEEFRKLLAETKLGNHPTMMRMFRLVGERISEEPNFVRADAGAAVTQSREELWYPSMAKKE